VINDKFKWFFTTDSRLQKVCFWSISQLDNGTKIDTVEN
jgi:hypothetical protein